MLTGFYTGVSGIHFNQERLNVIANNVSNADTSGFRRGVMILQNRPQEPKTFLIDSNVKSRLPSFYGLMREQILTTKTGSGTKRHTDNPFDVSIDPELANGFFKVKKPSGFQEGDLYTRDGTLSIGPEKPGDPSSSSVIYTAGNILLDESGSPIAISASGGAPKINSAGVVTQGGAVLGKIPVYRFNKFESIDQLVDSDIELLDKLGGSLYKVPKGYETEFNPIKVELGQAGVSSILSQGYAERSNVSVVSELSRMMEVEKSAQANQLAANMHVEGLQKLFQVVRNG